MKKKANKNNIWQVPIYLPYVNDPLSNESIKAAENELGQTLPEEYLDLLHIQNGGYICWTLKDSCHGQIWGIGDQYPHLDVPNWDAYEIDELRGVGNSLIPFDGDGHWLLCLDYRKRRRSPQVTLVETEESGPATRILYNNFAEYLTHLQHPGFYGSPVIGVRDPLSCYDLVSEVAKHCRLKFNPIPQYFDTGFPKYEAKRKRGDAWHMLVGSPNLIPRTFVRMQDYRRNPTRFDRLQRLFPGSCYRFSNHPDVLHTLYASDEAMPAIANAVREMGLNHVVIDPSKGAPR